MIDWEKHRSVLIAYDKNRVARWFILRRVRKNVRYYLLDDMRTIGGAKEYASLEAAKLAVEMQYG